MGKEGPCYHCGIEQTPLWRNGPPDKPVLCNACGSRWRTRGTLNDYTPKHAMREAQLNGEFLPTELGVANSDHSSGIVGIRNNSSSSGSPSTDNFTDVANTPGPSEPIFQNLPKRRRSILAQIILSPIERLSKQLFDIAHEHPEVFLKEPNDEDMFVDQATSSMSTPLETPLGAMLLASPAKKLEPTVGETSYDVKPTISASYSVETGGN